MNNKEDLREMEGVDNKNFGGVSFEMDVTSQKEGNAVYHHVDNLICISNQYLDENGEKVICGQMAWDQETQPDFKKGWALERYDGVFKHALYNWAVASTVNRPDGGYSEVDGVIAYTDWNGLAEQCRKYVDGGLKPLLMFQGVPEQIAAGGFKPGVYAYNVTQPSDYQKWFQYLIAVMNYLIDNFGTEEVSTWAFCLWSESYHQFAPENPETGGLESEFHKMYDYWSAALQLALGKEEIYIGVYFAFPDQEAATFIQHCSSEINYYTGKKGTHLGWVGFSNWVMGGNILSDNNLNYYYDVIEKELDKSPLLDNTDVLIIEAGCLENERELWSDVTYAENYGAAYYAWRIEQYTNMPRLRRCISFYNNTTGDDVYESGYGVKNNWKDDMLTPSFQVWKMSETMDQERLLQIIRTGVPASENNVLGAVATSDDTVGNECKILVYNTNPDIEDNSDEVVELQLSKVPSTSITIKKYMIDCVQNNWWSEWTKYREENQISYILRGHGIGLTQKSTKLHKCVWETTNDEGYEEWLKKIPEYKEKEKLTATGEAKLEVQDGTVSWAETLTGHSVLYMVINYS